MGLILDSSVVIAAERRGDTVEKLIEWVVSVAGDQAAALSAVGLTELAHGIYRAQNPEIRERRQAFIDDLLRALVVYPYTTATALLAAKIDGEQQARGSKSPSAICWWASRRWSLASVLTVNVRHFRIIPGLQIVQL